MKNVAPFNDMSISISQTTCFQYSVLNFVFILWSIVVGESEWCWEVKNKIYILGEEYYFRQYSCKLL